MARAAGLWLAAVLCFYIYITTTRIDGFPQGSIIRAKRDLDENFEDALFEKEEGLLSKREAKDADEDKDSSGNKAEEPAVTSDSTKKSDTGDKVTIDSEESVEEGSENAEDSPANKDEKPKKSDAEDQKAETRHNVEGKNADIISENLLTSGMDSNVDRPMTNGDLIKKYEASQDTSNGELLGMAKRTNIVTQPSDKNSKIDSTETVKRTDVTETPKTKDDTEQNDAITKRQNIEEPRLFKRAEKDKETHDIQEGGAPSHFQVDDKSADLEINANSAGVKVKAKPASLQVVSRPGQHGAPPMMPFMPPPIPVMHHLPHHHRHHHHHHHRRHHYPQPFFYPPMQPYPHQAYFDEPYRHFEQHEHGYGYEPHFFAPYGHDEGGYSMDHPRWGEGYGDGYHLYGRHHVGGQLYGRSTVETAQDPRLSTPAALDGFNSGIALPDMDQRFMRVSHLPGTNVRYEHVDDDFKSFGPPTMEEERQAEQGEYRYHVPRTPHEDMDAPHPDMVEHHHTERRLKRRYKPVYPEYRPQRPRYGFNSYFKYTDYSCCLHVCDSLLFLLCIMRWSYRLLCLPQDRRGIRANAGTHT